MKKIKVICDDSRLAQTKTQIQVLQDRMSSFLSEIRKQGFDFNIPTTESLQQLVNHPIKILKNIATDAVTSTEEFSRVFPFKISKNKLSELIDVDFSEISKLAELLKADIHLFQYLRVSGLSVSVDVNELERLEDSLTIWAKSPVQVELAEKHQQLVRALDEFNTCVSQMKSIAPPLNFNLGGLSTYIIKNSNQPAKVNPEFYWQNKHEFNSL